ncbi:ABC transporter substrate-binding protein [Plantactinospora sp. DSM 117369]
MRLARWVATAVALSLAVTACGNGSSNDSDGPVDLRVVVWSGNEAHLKILNDLAAAFVKANPDVASVKVESTPSGQNYRTVLTTQISGGDSPDVGWLGEGDAPDFIAAKGLVDLGPTVRGDASYNHGDLISSQLGVWAPGDKVYGIPFSTSPAGVFYNADMFARARLPTPDEMVKNGTWTWENLAAVAKKLHDTLGVGGFYIGPYQKFDDQWISLSHLWAGFDAAPWSADGTTCTFTDQKMVDAMTFLHKMITVDKGYPGPGVAADFAAGQAGMISTYISTAVQLKQASFKWGLVPQPTGPAGSSVVIGQSAFVAFAGSKHPEQAAKLVAFLTNEESSKQLIQYFPSIRRSLVTADALSAANPLLSKEQLQAVVVDGITNGKRSPVHTNMGEIAPEVRVNLEPLWKPGADVAAVMKKTCDAITPLLAKTR